MHTKIEYKPVAKQEMNQPMCWACWETRESPENRLIRACHGCKDKDLQYIHESCINTYIKNIVNSKNPRGYAEEPVPFVAEDTINALLKQHQEKINAAWQRCTGVNCSEWLEKIQILKPFRVVDGNVSLNFMDIKCTRCLDEYDIVAQKVSAPFVLMHDKVLRALVFLMTLSMMVLTWACVEIILRSNRFLLEYADEPNIEQHLLIKSIFFFYHEVDIRFWAGALLSVFSVAYCATVGIVLWHSSGYYYVKVNARCK
jgi:hypothetical protein